VSTGWEEIDVADRQLVRAGEEWHSELYRIATSQFLRCADVLDLDQESRERLIEPRRSLIEATEKVADAADKLDLDWRTAAMTVAVNRVAQAAKLRAIYP
jgi:hypothetical protein